MTWGHSRGTRQPEPWTLHRPLPCFSSFYFARIWEPRVMDDVTFKAEIRVKSKVVESRRASPPPLPCDCISFTLRDQTSSRWHVGGAADEPHGLERERGCGRVAYMEALGQLWAAAGWRWREPRPVTGRSHFDLKDPRHLSWAAFPRRGNRYLGYLTLFCGTTV